MTNYFNMDSFGSMSPDNWEAVAAFLNAKISFVQIADVVDHCLSHHDGRALDSVDAVEELEKAVRSAAAAYIKTIA